MNMQMKQRTERKRCFRPRLEVLESRCLLNAGGLDLTFGTGGKVTTDFEAFAHANAVAMQPDDKIVVAGSTSSFGRGFDDDFALARYNPDGTLDTSFSSDGKVTTDLNNGSGDIAKALAIQSDGKIVAAGVAASINSSLGIVRYNPDGTLDSTFGLNGKQVLGFPGHNFITSAMAIANGWIWVAGTVNTVEFGLTRFDLGGNLDHSFGDNGLAFAHFGVGDDSVHGNAMAVQSNGQLVVAGTAVDHNTGVSDVAVARFNTDGTLDQAFGSGGTLTTHVSAPADARAVAIQSDGGIVVAGSISTDDQAHGFPRDFLLARYLRDGTLDSNFGAHGIVTTDFIGLVPCFPAFDVATGVAIQADGRIIAAGTSDERFALARYFPDGSLDPNFGVAGEVVTQFGLAEANAVTLQSDGKVVAVGESFDNAPNQHFALARYNPFNTFTMAKIGPALNVLGTITADQLDVRDDGAGNITVSSGREDIVPFVLHGIHHVMIDTGGGDDVVNYQMVGSTPIGGNFPGLQFADLDVSLGRGDDLFSVEVDVPPGPCMPSDVIAPTLRISADGGDGNDTFRTAIAGPQPTTAGDLGCLDTNLALDYQGDGGNDSFLTDVSNVGLNGVVAVNMTGGQGDDLFRTTFGNVAINAPLTLINDGGLGDDNIALICGFKPQTDPPVMPGVVVAVPVEMILDGGFGRDNIVAICGFNPQPDRPAFPAMLVQSRFQLDARGGAGDDTLTGILLPAVQRGGSFSAVFDGGDGRDVLLGFVEDPNMMPGALADVAFLGGRGDDLIDVQVSLMGFTPESGRLHVAVDGGEGSDHLVFLVRGIERPMDNALFTLDGGRGEDFAVASALVHVMNCEHVEVI